MIKLRIFLTIIKFFLKVLSNYCIIDIILWKHIDLEAFKTDTTTNGSTTCFNVHSWLLTERVLAKGVP